MGSHADKLRLRLINDGVDVLRHLRDRLDIVAVLLVNLLLKLLDKLLLISDDLITGSFLRINVLSQFFAIFFLFKLLPIPINFHILLVTLDDLVLNLVGALFLSLFLKCASFFINLLCVRLDLINLDLLLIPLLLQEALGLLYSGIAIRLNP